MEDSKVKIKICGVCKFEFTKHKKFSRTQWDNAKYCSKSCGNIGRTGAKRSDLTKLKLSIAHKGTSKPWSGKYKRTDEHRKIIQAGVSKFYNSEASISAREKISLFHTGRKASPQSIEKMKETWKKSPHYRGGKETLRERKNFYERQRNFRKYNNGGKHSLEEWRNMKVTYNFICPSCHKKEPDIKLTEDHIVPLSKGGLNSIDNIQPLCIQCNSSKNNKTIKYDIRK